MPDDDQKGADSPEGVALELLREILRAEGGVAASRSNKTPKDYILDLYEECLRTAKGERVTRPGDGQNS